ncbi:TetR/AcrR family transcriptional regulator [Streptomyces sp. NPDC046942]|uniref:TetR/AcrR family transcriptional regulator n=1 Tax=Streptomyces sp. NPDC046942 TaxID=3155137 RepID=UPI00340C27CD
MGTSGGRRPRRTDDDRPVREEILDAARRLLAERRFDELSVADILNAASVARGSFYFYFSGKHEVLAELVRQAVERGHKAARPWLAHEGEDQRYAAVRHGITEGARLWQEEAPVLRAIVENWRTDPGLTQLWLELMNGFTDATAGRLAEDQVAGDLPPDTPDLQALATALTWLGERLYYLAALDLPPFNDQDTLVEVLTHIWMSTLYPTAGTHAPGSS